MGEWVETTLGELCRQGGGGIQTGPFGSQLHASDYVQSGIPSVMPQNIGDNKIVEEGIARIKPEDAERLSRYLLAAGDIVYSRRGNVERRALVRDGQAGWLCGTGCLRVRVGDGADPRFLSYLLGSPDVREWIVRHAVGATMPNLNTSILGALPLNVPSRDTQASIADLLGALDDKIAVNERIAATCESLSVALASEEKWLARTELNELVQQQRSQVSPSELADDSVAHYSLPAFDASRAPEIVQPGTIKSAKFLIDRHSVLVSKLNPATPRIWDVNPDPELPALASTEFMVLRPVDGLNPAEVWSVCCQPGFTEQLSSRATGTSNSHQRVRPAELLKSMVVDVRTIPEEIRMQISDLAKRARAARYESIALAQLRDTLLPKLMSGELRVRDAEKMVEDAT